MVLRFGILAFLCGTAPIALASAAGVVRPAASFDRSDFTVPGSGEEVRLAGNLKGTHWGVAGWAEYDFDITERGWYQIWVQGGAQEYLVDAPKDPAAEPAAYFSGGSGVPGDPDKVGNVWLEEGRHRVRVQSYIWYGFIDFRSIELRRSRGDVAGSIAIAWPRAGRIFRLGQCPDFDLQSGGRREATRIRIKIQDDQHRDVGDTQDLALPVDARLTRQRFHVSCASAGTFRVSVAIFEDGQERDLDWQAVKGFDYEVVDTRDSAAVPRTDPSGEELVASIDCARARPDYGSGGTSLRTTAAGTYLESAQRGWVPFQAGPATRSAATSGPSWFAYVLAAAVPGGRYRIDVDYPDDADRTFGIFFREGIAGANTMGIGVDSGGPYRLSNAMQTTGLVVWPRAANPRLVFAPARDGTRAACSRIRVLRLAPVEPAPVVRHSPGTREFVNWYEEGVHFVNLYGARGQAPREISRAIDRWAGTVAAQGGTTLMPTVLVYAQQLFPSRYARMAMDPERDWLRRIVLAAERSHLKVIAELHPRADELSYGMDDAHARKLLLTAADGRDDYFAPDGHTRNRPPHFNVLLPQTQAWLVSLVGELADRYADSPSFEGLSLRVMSWANSALSNLGGLEWGYGDETIGRFEADTGIAVPAASNTDAGRFARRYAWLSTAGRAPWTAWRCRQMTGLYELLARRVQQARPDLSLYIHAFPGDEGRPFTATDTPRERLLQAGLDVDALRSIPGVVLVDATARYGRRDDDSVKNGLMQALRDPAVITSLQGGGASGRFIVSHNYLEATDRVIPPGDLGFAADTSANWASLAANPPGRAALERFAAELAQSDALMLGDGGNAYVYAVPGLEQFLASYTRLPARSFADRAVGSGPIVVRTLDDDARQWIYAVNPDGAPHALDLHFDRAGSLQNLADGTWQAASDRLAVTLPPYGIFAARADAHMRLVE